ncbi:hypothetical protein TNCV_3432801 [Trichonephila clavipes]|nr:hypothetical protein TNCV_3432801 [Trichonephila clavipes]
MMSYVTPVLRKLKISTHKLALSLSGAATKLIFSPQDTMYYSLRFRWNNCRAYDETVLAQHGARVNIRRVTIPLVKWSKGKRNRRLPDHLQGVLVEGSQIALAPV